MATYTFTYDDDFDGSSADQHREVNNKMTFVTNSQCWTEAMDAFFHFLQGCGFVIDREDVADFLLENIEFEEHDNA